jgi:ubiquinone biosynthesis protein UbiJ
MNQSDSHSESATPTADTAEAGFLTPFPRLLAAAMQRSLRTVQRRNEELAAPPQQAFIVHLQGLGLTLRFAGDADQQLVITAHPPQPEAGDREDQADTTSIAATPVTLVMQSLGNPAKRSVNIRGDATLAQAWQLWLRDLFALPLQDPERHLSERFGPVLGVQLNRVLNGLKDWTGMASEHGAATVREYLQEESGLLVTAAEMEQFLDQIDELSERIERLQARLR